MKLIQLSEDDTELFCPFVNDKDIFYYAAHKDAFRCMWKDQGHLFWVNTIIKFRICLLRHGRFFPYVDMASNGALDYPFLRIAEKMTAKHGDVVELMHDINIVSVHAYLLQNMTKQTYAFDPFINPTTRTSFRNLFGPPDNKLRIVRTVLFSEIFCAWAGALIRLLARWVKAPTVSPDRCCCTPPTVYVISSDFRPTLFERYLKQKWKDSAEAVCGAPPERLTWWTQVNAAESLQLPPLEEYRVLQVIMELITRTTEAAGGGSAIRKAKESKRAASAGRNGTAPTRPTAPPSTAKPGVSGGAAAAAPVRAATDANPASSAKKKKNKKKKRGSKSVALPVDGGAAKAADPAASPAAGPAASPAADSAFSLHQESFPQPTAATAAAALDWHEYVTTLGGGGEPLRCQLLGGQLYFNWLLYLMRELLVTYSHVQPKRLVRFQSQQDAACRDLMAVRKALQPGACVALMRQERDALPKRMGALRKLADVVLLIGVVPGPDSADELASIRSMVDSVLYSEGLRIYPVKLQYSTTELAGNSTKCSLVDMSRVRYVVRKGLALLREPVPHDPAATKAAVTAALEWYPELVATEWYNDVRVPPIRLARHLPEWLYGPALRLEALEAGFEMPRWALNQLRELTCDGQLPHHTDVMVPQTSQGLVDFCWARLASMVLIIDLLGLLRCSESHRIALAVFKGKVLWDLLDVTLMLQITQLRWIHPRAEVQLPRSPAFSQPPTKESMQRHLVHAAAVFRIAHSLLQGLFAELMSRTNQDIPEEGCSRWHLIHHDGDHCHQPCLKQCQACDEHETDVRLRVIMTSVWGLLVPERIVVVKHADVAMALFQDTLADWHCVVRYKRAAFNITVNAMDFLGPALVARDQLDAAMDLFCQARAIEYLEGRIRSVLLRIPGQMCNSYREYVSGKITIDWRACVHLLKEAGHILGLDVVRNEAMRTARVPDAPLSPMHRFGDGVHWPTVLADADTNLGDWRCWVVSPSQAGALLGRDRLSPDHASRALCLRMLGRDAGRQTCIHSSQSDKLVCMCLSTLRNIRFVKVVLSQLGAGAELSVHQSMYNVLTEAWLPVLLAADSHGVRHGWNTAQQQSSLLLLQTCYYAVDKVLHELYRPRPKLGGGKVLRADRLWLLSLEDNSWLRPDVTILRTISWNQAYDMHIDIMRNIMLAMTITRVVVPPIYQEDGVEVHATPRPLLEMAEVGSVVLLGVFLEARDGGRGSWLVDVTELPRVASLALDLSAWIRLVNKLAERMTDCGMPVLTAAMERDDVMPMALRRYEQALRSGSLLEFLALRQTHAEPLRWAVRGHQLLAGGQPAAAERLFSRVRATHFPLCMPRIESLLSVVRRTSRLPEEWAVRLQQLRRVLTVGQPQLVDSVLVVLDYQLDFGSIELPACDRSPALDPANVFNVKDLDPVALCKFVFAIGQALMAQHTVGKLYDYTSRRDHISPDLEHFVEPFTERAVAIPDAALEWAAAHVKRVTGSQRNGAAAGAADTDQDRRRERLQLDAVVSLTRQMNTLRFSTDHLSEIPEEPLAPEVLEAAGRKASALCGQLETLLDDQLRCAATKLSRGIEQAVTRQLQGQPDGRPIAGSAMSVVDACLARLTSVVEENGVAVKPSAAPQTATVRSCSFCERREAASGSFQLCSLCVAGQVSPPRTYCGRPCQKDDWEMGHWEDHQ